MKVLLSLARESRGLLALALFASAANGVFVSLTVSLMNDALDVRGGDLLRLGLEFALLSVAMTGFRWLALGQFVRLSQITLARLRLRVSRYIAHAPYREVEAHGAPRLLALLSEDIGTVGECFMLLPWLLVHGAVIAGCLGYLAFLSWQVFALVAAVICLGSLGYARGARVAHARLRAARLAEDDLFSHFRALVSGAKELKLHAARRQEFLSRLLARDAERVRRRRTRGLLVHAALANWRVFLFFAAIGGVVFLVAPALGAASDVRSGYALMLLYMMLPVNAVLEATPALSRMQVALERIQAFGAGLDAPAVELEAGAPEPLQRLSLHQVTHRHGQVSEDAFALGPIDLTLEPGELVFLVGGNGSGKTTLAKLLVGLYEPSAGCVTYNGRPVTAEQREAYRQNFAAVFPDFHLFESLLGHERLRLDERAGELLRAFDLQHKVRVEDGVFSTTALSSGQQKRLALLVAWLEDRPVYVFDEWAADQDPAYKRVFYGELLPALKARGKAVLVITHDERYFHLADRCLRLEAGKLTEDVRPASMASRAPRPDFAAALRAGLTLTGDP